MEQTNKLKSIPISQKRMCAFLLLKNHKLICVKQDKNNPLRSVFLFKKDENILGHMKDYHFYKETIDNIVRSND